MQLVRGCLMTLGLILLLMITSCVVGVSSCSRVFDPREFARTVDEKPDQTRRMVRDFMEGATYESDDALKVRNKPLKVTVQDFTDGSVHLIAAQDGAKLMEITAVFLPKDEGRTRIEVVSDARPLANATYNRTAVDIHRAIKDRFDAAFAAIDQQRVLPQGLLVSQLIAKPKKRRWL